MYFHIFQFFFPNIGMRSLPNILPSVKFRNFGNFSCFSCFSCFSWKKKGKIWGKSCSIRTALTTTRNPGNTTPAYCRIIFPHVSATLLAVKTVKMQAENSGRSSGCGGSGDGSDGSASFRKGAIYGSGGGTDGASISSTSICYRRRH